MGKHLDRANILLDLDKYDLAETALRQEIAENPDSDIAHGSLARCLINQRKLDSVTLETLEYALSLNAENDWLHYLFAVYWHMKGEFRQAQQAIGAAIELDPNSALYFDTLARILFDRGNNIFKAHNRIMLTFLFVYIISAWFLIPIYWVASIALKGYWLRSYLKPVTIPLAKALALDPEYLSAINLQTQLLIETNRWHRALPSSLNALQVDPSDSTAHKLHAQVLLRSGKYTAAVEHFQSELRIDPSSKESKAGLLEAVRSQYWLYRWISITNWRGRFFLFTTIAIKVLIISFNEILALVTFTDLIFVVIIAISLVGKPIFNLILQLNPKNKLMITNSIPIQYLVFGNYFASIIIASISLSYSSIYLTILASWLDYHIVNSILTIVGSVFVSIVTFLPVTDRQRFRSLPFIYQSIVCGLGLLNIISCLSRNDINLLIYSFAWLVFLSPLFAIYSSRKFNR